MNDREAVKRQLGREPKPFKVAARCPFGLPAVIENEPSRSLPTTFWLTCAHLVCAVSRVESEGGVRRAREEVGGTAVEEVHRRHEELHGGRVAGVRDGGQIKCLHAFTALHLADDVPNPVARWTLKRVEKPYPEGRCCTLKDGAGGRS